LTEVVAREAQVSRLLGDVDLHDAAEERVQLPATPQRHALHVVDGVFPAQDEDEEQLRKGAPEGDHQPGAHPLPPHQAVDVVAAAIDELLEHQRVLRLLDDLVIGVRDLGGAVGQAQGELEQAPLQHSLELEPDLHEGGHHVEADRGADARGPTLVPLGPAEHVVRRQLPARIVGVDVELWAVPGDVGIRVEVLHHGLLAQPGNQLRIALGTSPARGTLPLLLGDQVLGTEHRSAGGLHGLFSFLQGAPDVGGITRRASAFSASITWAARVSSPLATRLTASPSSSASTKLGATAKNGLSPATGANRSRNVCSTTSRMYVVSSATRGRSPGSARGASATSRQASARGPQSMDHRRSRAAA